MSDDQEPEVTIEDIDENEKAAHRFAPLLIARGVIGIIAGIILLFWPGTGLAVAAITLGIFLTVDGLERLIVALRSRPESGRVDAFLIIGAFLRIVLGLVVLFNPVNAGGFWVSFIFIIAGLNLVFGSIVLFWRDNSLRNEPMKVGMAILMLVMGLLMILMPMISAMFLLRLIGGTLILAAVPSLALGLRSR